METRVLKIKLFYSILILSIISNTSALHCNTQDTGPIDLGGGKSDSNEGIYKEEVLDDDDFMLPDEPAEPVQAQKMDNKPAYNAFNHVADKPSTCIGSNDQKAAPIALSPQADSQTPSVAPINTFKPTQPNGGTRQQLEDAAAKCTREIEDMYRKQNQVSQNNMPKFQNRIGEAHENCEKI